MAEIDAVVLDLGGVVVRIARTWQARAQAAGLPAPESPQYEQALHACEAHIMGMQRGQLTTKDVAKAWCARTGSRFSTDEVILALNRQILGPMPGVAAVIASLSVPWAIFSNTSADHWQQLLPLPTVERARWRIASFEIGATKPDARAYEHVETVLGTSGSRLLFFDDSEANVAAACARGWQAAHIDHQADVAAQLTKHLRDKGLLTAQHC